MLTLVCIKWVPRDPSTIFWQPFLLEKGQKPQISFISLVLCWKKYDTIILLDVDRIPEKLWSLLQFSSGSQGPIIKTILTISCAFCPRSVEVYHVFQHENGRIQGIYGFWHFPNKTGKQMYSAWIPVNWTPSSFSSVILISEETYK